MKYILFKKYIHRIICIGFLCTCLLSCKKQDDWLNIKNNKSDVSPQTLQDFQAVLDNSTIFNNSGSIIGLVGSDNLYVPDTNLDGETPVNRNTYLWAKDIYQGTSAQDWLSDYQQIEYANVVLDGLNKLSSAENLSLTAKLIKGEALFFRAYGFYQLSQIYCRPYEKASAGSDPGIPLRVTSDVTRKVDRGTVQQCYDQMTNDLKLAVSLLPSTSLYKTRPNSNAANALLAKIYLSMGDYVNAYSFADAALKTDNTLLNFNSLKITSSDPFPSFAKGNPEIIFYEYCYGLSVVFLNSTVTGRVAPDFYNSYVDGDLRKTAFYVQDGATGLFKAKGSFSAKGGNFCGIANGEIYLIRAESAIRNGDLQSATSDLNTLLQNRLTTASYIPYSNNDPKALLSKILLERRKELAYTGNMRWEDLRRLNQDPQFAVTIKRTYQGTNYTLQPNDKRYVLPLPQDELTLENLTQNPR
ncbi:RagB/SusD family nutrient uptake outer membrane protein [Mucilaginibacter polytrichastri]|uniref:RagB/SusD domain-containing protein n=1 Tax=Mucilaginibacter polytrichastri TaxID=1302689 RepID=A0A1Q6A412_9SPHI|nr:RagB/SusD family nutrient uptake outer membrane protein [Mucilaginibacter polytrichastri]OKS88742.1 hypothetical protein RG47T_4220 [Mucilaginibacter polytrichastri]SFT05103.1 SusD family protein [Mucilaginibacter polytrichastri]